MISLWSLLVSSPFLSPVLFFSLVVHPPLVAPVPNEGGVVSERYGEGMECLENTLECWRGFYTALMDLRGTRTALQDLKARTLAQEPVESYCHELLHEIGRREYAESGSLSYAYARGDAFCRAGYYHGVLEAAFEDTGPSLLKNIDALCARVPGKDRYAYQYFSCVHGIGHGLMAYYNHDLFQSLDGCTRLTGEWEVHSCAGGVFMENVMSDSPDQPSKFLKPDDLLYPCSEVGARFEQSCYLMQTSYMLKILDGDFAHVFTMCASLDEPLRGTCYESLGRDASGWSGGSLDEVERLCSSTDDLHAQTHCITGAAIDFIQSRDRDVVLSLCERAPDRDLCREFVQEHLSSL